MRWYLRFLTRVATLILISTIACPVQMILARDDDRKKAPEVRSVVPSFGRIEVSTTPGGYPLTVDGQPNGETTEAIRMLDLSPGRHVIEIDFGAGNRWIKEFNVVAGRRITVELGYKPPVACALDILAPSTVNDGDIVTFKADVTNAPSRLNYKWQITPASARIVSGEGSPEIRVDTTGLGKQPVTATLLIDQGTGNPKCQCQKTARAVANVAPLAPPVVGPSVYDQFRSVAFDDDKARLDNLAIELQSQPTATAHIIVYGGRNKSASQTNALVDRTRNYLVNVRRIDPNRVNVVNGGNRENTSFEFWMVPQGAETPQATPTIKAGEGAQPKARGRATRRR
jgi:hypothetical protein